MAPSGNTKDDKLTSMILPLRGVGAEFKVVADELMGKNKIFGSGKSKTDHRAMSPRVEGSIIDLGRISVLSGRTTPIHAWEEDVGTSSITMCFAGAPCYQDGDGRIQARPGDILVIPRNGGRISTGYLSSINFPIEHQRLSRTMRAMQCDIDCSGLGRAFTIEGRSHSQHIAAAGGLFSFFAFIDSLLFENRHIGIALGLDEQIYRLFAFAVMRSSGVLERVQERWGRTTNHWTNHLDDLVDYIRLHAHQGLTLTDLEEQSNYSARHLQNLFKEKFDCTPMQFVRRQRLSNAMERLRLAKYDDTVARIARDSGYRHTSNFTTDFQREFGIKPSAVLRASKQSPER